MTRLVAIQGDAVCTVPDSRLLAALRAALLPRLVSGELRVAYVNILRNGQNFYV